MKWKGNAKIPMQKVNSFAGFRYRWVLFHSRKYHKIFFLRNIIFAITGHWRIALSPAPNCPGCDWCMCPVLCKKRFYHLGSYFFNEPWNISIKAKINFASSIWWIDWAEEKCSEIKHVSLRDIEQHKWYIKKTNVV